MEPCLWQGVNFAKTIAYLWDLPIIPTNHIEGHIIANWLKPISSKSKIKNQKSKIQLKIKKLLPAICLVVSGGHTQLILMKDIGKYKIIGETRDDAAGECFDKTARILGIGYPGGPAIAKMATKYKMPTVRPLFAHCSHTAHSTQQDTKYKIQDTKYKIHLPRPMIYQKNYDFSFSGLKTAVLYDFKKQSSKVRKSKEYIKEMCSEIQQAVIDVLIYKTLKAVKDFKVKTIILGGGVAANEELRKQFNYQLKTINYKLKFLVPPKIFCTDNAAMIAVVAYFHWQKGETKNWEDIKTNANLRIS